MTTEYLMKEEMEHVLAALTAQNELVCRVAVETGLRIGDVLNLRTEGLRQRMWVTETKTGKKRRVNFRADTFRRMEKNCAGGWVFPGRNDLHHRTRQAVWKDVKRAAKAFRIPQNVAPHSLRKVYAVDVFEKEGLEKCRKALNHADKATTLLYCMAAQIYKEKYIDGTKKHGHPRMKRRRPQTKDG